MSLSLLVRIASMATSTTACASAERPMRLFIDRHLRCFDESNSGRSERL